jgi:hypothetical protein
MLHCSYAYCAMHNSQNRNIRFAGSKKKTARRFVAAGVFWMER